MFITQGIKKVFHLSHNLYWNLWMKNSPSSYYCCIMISKKIVLKKFEKSLIFLNFPYSFSGKSGFLPRRFLPLPAFLPRLPCSRKGEECSLLNSSSNLGNSFLHLLPPYLNLNLEKGLDSIQAKWLSHFIPIQVHKSQV